MKDRVRQKEKSLSPMRIDELQVGVVHAGRQIKGIIVSPPFSMVGTRFVLEDAFGAAVVVSVYYDEDDVQQRDVQLRADADFPVGKQICIAEPFYKIANDGSPMIRVDMPSMDISTVCDARPLDAAAWHSLGNHFYSCEYRSMKGAKESWTRAVSLLGPPTSILLSNCSAAYLQIGQNGAAALYAGAGLHIDPTNHKAAFRLVSALSRVRGQHANSTALASLCADHFPALQDLFHSEYSGDHATCPEWRVDEPWWEADEVVNHLLDAVVQNGVPKHSVTSSNNPGQKGSRPPNWEEIKATANNDFRASRFPQAIDGYLRALDAQPECERISQLFSNLAVTVDENHDGKISSLGDATCAIVLRPRLIKAWVRRASALSALGLHGAVVATCKAAHTVASACQQDDLSNSEQKTLQAAIHKLCRLEQAAADGISTHQLMSTTKINNAARVTPDSAHDAMLRTLRFLLMKMPAKEQVRVFGERIQPLPNYTREVLSHPMGLPIGVDHGWALKYLDRSYNNAAMLPYSMEMSIRNPEWTPSIRDTIHRLGNNDPRKLRWWSCVDEGFVYDDGQSHTLDQGWYPTCMIRHSFSNQVYSAETFICGTTHVAVGFVDLGMLLFSDFIAVDGHPSVPCRFVGVESSPYAIAKALVLWQMLQQAPPPSQSAIRQAHLKSVLQVWFSTTWTNDTRARLDVALKTLLSDSSTSSNSQRVRRLLQYWRASAGVPLHQARSEHAKSTDENQSYIGCLLRKADRVAMARYELTGDVGVGNKPACGNILRFDCPSDVPPAEQDESILCTLELQSVISAVQKAGGSISVLEAAEALLLTGLDKLSISCRAGHVTTEFRCAPFENIVDEIAALSPRTISWSNIPDYFTPTQFHRLARLCSVQGTLHWASSMNWVSKVRGAFLMDYESATTRSKILESSHKAFRENLEETGMKLFLRCPLPENPFNSTLLVLAPNCFPKWLAVWLHAAQNSGTTCILDDDSINAPALINPLTPRGSSSFLFKWRYGN